MLSGKTLLRCDNDSKPYATKTLVSAIAKVGKDNNKHDKRTASFAFDGTNETDEENQVASPARKKVKASKTVVNRV
jgi:hypothetical protein